MHYIKNVPFYLKSDLRILYMLQVILNMISGIRSMLFLDYKHYVNFYKHFNFFVSV